MIYGYARCSTNEKKQDINRQLRELKEMGCTDKTIYWEYESGTKIKRIELLKLMDIVEPGDVIVVTEISRITRSTKQLCDIVELIKEKHLKLIIKNSITIDCTNKELDPMTEAFIKMSGVFAELERNMISSRVKSGMVGKDAGRRKTTIKDIPANFVKYYEKYIDGEFSKIELGKLTGFSRPTVNKYIAILKGDK